MESFDEKLRNRPVDTKANSENSVVSHETTNLPLSTFKLEDSSFIIFRMNTVLRRGGVLSCARLVCLSPKLPPNSCRCTIFSQFKWL